MDQRVFDVFPRYVLLIIGDSNHRGEALTLDRENRKKCREHRERGLNNRSFSKST